MKCPINGKPCSKYKGFHITEKVGGKTQVFEVCEDCLHSNMKKIIEVPQEANDCEMCGMSLNDLLKSTRVGCPNCYFHFGKTICHIVASAQNSASNIKHVGSVPMRHKIKMAESEDLDSFLIELEYESNVAIKNERYEDVPKLISKMNEFRDVLARYRDQVRADEFLETEIERRAPSIRKELAEIILKYREQKSAKGL
jgi:protein-arginine kinase activator protein McsA